MDYLLSVDDKGKPPKSRLPDARSAYALFSAFESADLTAATDRARVQDVLDGAPPIPPQELRALGQTYRANLNWGEALADHESALAAYDDLVHGVDRLADTPSEYGDDNQRAVWSDIIAEEFHELLVNWDEFDFQRQLLAHHFVSQGLGVLYWEDNRNWKFSVSSINDFKIEKNAWACDSKLEMACLLRSYPAGKVWKWLENREAAQKAGWDVKFTLDVLSKLPQQGYSGFDRTNPEEIQRAYKNNDQLMSAKIPQLRVIHYYVREFNGSYSHFIGLRDATADKFLYSNIGRFASANQAFVVFPFGIGTNGSFHSIRGLSHKNFAHVQTSNRLRNAALDGAFLRAALMLKSNGGASDRQQLTMAYAGALSLLPDGTEPVNVQLPNVANEVLPVIREMQILRKQNNGGYLSHVLSPEGGDRTAYEVQAQIAQSNILTSASLDQFYTPWGKMLSEVFRRLKREKWFANEPGAQEALRFRKNLAKRGVPWEAVLSVQRVKPVRAVGYGSPAARMAAFKNLMQLFPYYDPAGQDNLVRDLTIANVGAGMANRYKARVAPRPGMAAKIAELENDSMQSGRSVQVLPDEDHFVHSMVHSADAQQFIQAVQNNQIDPTAAFRYLLLQQQHFGTHLGYLSPQDARQGQIAQMKKIFGVIREVVEGLGKQLANQQKQAQEQAQQQPQQGQQQVDPKLQLALEKHKLEMQMMKERHDTEMSILTQEAKLRMARLDAETAASVAARTGGGKPQPALATEGAGTAAPANATEFRNANEAP